MERKCAKCGKTFVVTDENACFVTCVNCRIQDETESHPGESVLSENFEDENKLEDELCEENTWDNAINALEGNS